MDKRSPIVNSLFFPSLWLPQLSTDHPAVYRLAVAQPFCLLFSSDVVPDLLRKVAFCFEVSVGVQGEAEVGPWSAAGQDMKEWADGARQMLDGTLGFFKKRIGEMEVTQRPTKREC